MDIFRRNFNKLAVVTIFTALFIAEFHLQDYGISVDEKFKDQTVFIGLTIYSNFTNLEDLKHKFFKIVHDAGFHFIRCKNNFYGIL